MSSTVNESKNVLLVDSSDEYSSNWATPYVTPYVLVKQNVADVTIEFMEALNKPYMLDEGREAWRKAIKLISYIRTKKDLNSMFVTMLVFRLVPPEWGFEECMKVARKGRSDITKMKTQIEDIIRRHQSKVTEPVKAATRTKFDPTRSRCYNCGKVGHRRRDCFSRKGPYHVAKACVPRRGQAKDNKPNVYDIIIILLL